MCLLTPRCGDWHPGYHSTAAQRDNVIDFFDGVGSSTSYAVFDSGWKYIYDRFNDTYRYVRLATATLLVSVSRQVPIWILGSPRRWIQLAATCAV